MFLEQKANRNQRRGWIEIICGSMFSGKTEELLRRIKRAQFARQKIELFKPAIDNRYDKIDVVSHDHSVMPSTPVHNSSEILLYINKDETEVVAIDEVQFFDEGITEVCTQLANLGIRVIVAGLDMDYTGSPFRTMPKLMSVAEYVTKTHAICVKCGDLANFSHRLTQEDKLVVLGEAESYEPLCRNCYFNILKKT
ncbi:MAG: thymidine kinase [Bacteroidales bacterium]|jgi:thymidine kinase|nr:thymidine kinase [Bacteroidales bacterium]